MKGSASFLLGALSVLGLLVAFAVGRYGTDLRAALRPSVPGTEEGWRFEIAYEPLKPPTPEAPAADRPTDRPTDRLEPRREALPAPEDVPSRPRVQLPLIRATPRTTEPTPERGGLLARYASDPKEENGPELLGWYGDGEPSFRGTQVFDGEDWVRDGAWTAWHENGVEHEVGTYRAGVEHGPWQWFYDNGSPMAEGSFDEGRREGFWRFWYENGSLQMEGEYVHGVGSGLWTHYHETGGKKAQGPFQAGKPNGSWTVWTPRGAIDREKSGEYLAGVRVE